jgi:hypothetical protein
VTLCRFRVLASSSGWLAVAIAAALLVVAWVTMLRDGWTVASAAAVVASSWIAAAVYLVQEARRARRARPPG